MTDKAPPFSPAQLRALTPIIFVEEFGDALRVIHFAPGQSAQAEITADRIAASPFFFGSVTVAYKIRTVRPIIQLSKELKYTPPYGNSTI